MSIGYISGRAKGKRQGAKGGINNQFLITGFSITHLISQGVSIAHPLTDFTAKYSHQLLTPVLIVITTLIESSARDRQHLLN
ncbi:MAG: hypothetical protein EWV58_09855 [Microcystis aeruginosa Ma_MB_F_20061100_S19]|nr:MAG: hypothetical protein EWV58_09855 [Microcystis aeruginosa Ma_MB_F_20061100_S19]TRU16901.1 MAG: hypothetical protein EWV59_01130 [Microcystis aeruginosa Ma_MB_F_20061100_S19D]